MVPLIIKDTNAKLKSDCFIHIMRAPVKQLSVDIFPIHMVITDEAGNQFDADLLAVAKWKLAELSSIETYASSGMERSQFIDKYLAEVPGSKPDTEIGIYVYKKVK